MLELLGEPDLELLGVIEGIVEEFKGGEESRFVAGIPRVMEDGGGGGDESRSDGDTGRRRRCTQSLSKA